MPRRRRRSNLIRNLLLIVLLAVVLLMSVSPLIETMLPYNSTVSGWLEWTRSRVMETMVALWFFAFGSMVGSFINVVVWRMPRGVSVVAKGSACPFCTAKIRLQDNIPIFGWIKLGGRCRVCRLPISPRYPIVETLFGVVFLLMFFVELQTTCANLPGGKRYLSTGILQVVISTKWDVIAVYVYHMILMVMLMTWSLMAFDGSRIPAKTIVFAILIGFVGAISFPYLHPVKWIEGYETWFADLPWLQRIATSFLGLVCGFFAGGLWELSGVHRTDDPSQQTAHPRQASAGQGTSIGLMTIGLFTGWQFVFSLLFIFGVLLLLRSASGVMKAAPSLAILALATLAHLCLWRQINAVLSLPGDDPGTFRYWRWWIAGLLGAILIWCADRYHRPQASQAIPAKDVDDKNR